MIKHSSLEGFKAYAEAIFKAYPTREDAIKALCGKTEIRGQVYNIEYPTEGFTVRYVGSGTDFFDMDPSAESTEVMVEKIQQILRNLQVTGMGPASDEASGWIDGASGSSGGEPPPPEPPKPDEVGAVGGSESPKPSRRPIDLSHAEPELLSYLEGMSLMAQDFIMRDWPATTLDYAELMDTPETGRPMPGDQPAIVKGTEVMPLMLKGIKREFTLIRDFRAYVTEVFNTWTRRQAEWMTSGEFTVENVKLKIKWHDNKPHVTVEKKGRFHRTHQEQVRRRVENILREAIGERPVTPLSSSSSSFSGSSSSSSSSESEDEASTSGRSK